MARRSQAGRRIRIWGGGVRSGRNRSAALLALALVALVAIGCGTSAATATPAEPASAAPSPSAAPSTAAGATDQGGGAQPGGAPAGDLCSVVTQEQVNAAVGGPIGAGTEQNGGQMCLWQDPAVGQASIAIDTGGVTFSDICGPSDTAAVKVDGVGDGACYLVAGTMGTSLEFQKGAHSYSVHIVLPTGTLKDVEGAEKTLAQEAAGKL